MNCTHAHQMLDAWIDDELDDSTSAQIATHLKECPACLALKTDRDQLRLHVRAHAPYFNAPASLRQAAERFTGQAETVRADKSNNGPGWRMAGALISIAACMGVLAGYLIGTPVENSAREQLISSHVASLRDTQQLVVVASADRHTVKPWFQGKIDFAPTVKDLSKEGFTLLGGRLDHVGVRPAAALVYQIRNHTINVFVWRAAGEQSEAPVTTIVRGFSVTSWTSGGLRYSAISDVNRRDLERLAELLNTEAS